MSVQLASPVRPVAAPVAAGALLLAGCVGAAVVDPGAGPLLCPFKAATGFDCPGCGGTRAVHQLLSGDLVTALDFNILAVVALPLIFASLFVALTAAFGGPRWSTLRVSRGWTALGAVAVAVFWVARNLPVAPLSWLGT